MLDSLVADFLRCTMAEQRGLVENARREGNEKSVDWLRGSIREVMCSCGRGEGYVGDQRKTHNWVCEIGGKAAPCQDCIISNRTVDRLDPKLARLVRVCCEFPLPRVSWGRTCRLTKRGGVSL